MANISPLPVFDPKWKEMMLPHYLKNLRLYIQDEFKNNEETPKESQEALRNLIKRQEKSGAPGNISDAKKFLKDSIGVISRLLKRESDNTNSNILGDASQVALAIRNEEELLHLIAPNFSINPSGRWPGPVGYRSALNHLIAVSIRVHSLYPDAKFDVVLRASARRILVPALAHNLTFLRRTSSATFNYLLKTEKGIVRLSKLENIGMNVEVNLPDEEATLAASWIRLLNATLHFAQKSVEYPNELFSEIQRLTLEHEINPTGSVLWSELSLMASGDLSIDELLVSRVTSDLEEKLGYAASRPIISCARERFGLLRYSYGMVEEREKVTKKPAEALREVELFFKGLPSQTGTVKDKKLTDDLCKRAFGWAYLWSRYLLLGRADDTRMSSPEFKATKDKAGNLLEDILFQVYHHAEKKEYKQLALRYVTGFLTNPRFVRPLNLRENNHSKASQYVELLKSESLPKGLISLMNARLKLHEAYSRIGKSGFLESLNASLSEYADTLKSISASEGSENMMDGEVAAWAIPEMRFAVQLLKQSVNESGNKKKSMMSKYERIQKALDMVGEMQFGVYFNQEEETGRLEKGLQLGCP